MNVDLSNIDFSKYKLSDEELTAISLMMNKRGFYYRTDIKTFCETIMKEYKELNQAGIYQNWTGGELLTPDETKPIYEFFKKQYEDKEYGSEVFVSDTNNGEYDYYGEISLREIFLQIPSLFINFFQDKKYCNFEIVKYIHNSSHNILLIDYKKADIPFVKFLHDIGEFDKFRKMIGDSIVNNYYYKYWLDFNKSIFDGLEFKSKRITFDKLSVVTLAKNIENISFEFDLSRLSLKVNNTYKLDELYNFIQTVNNVEKLGKHVEYNKKEFQEEVRKTVDSLSEKEKIANQEIINAITYKPKSKQKKYEI